MEKLVRRYVKRQGKKDHAEQVRSETSALSKKLNVLAKELHDLLESKEQYTYQVATTGLNESTSV